MMEDEFKSSCSQSVLLFPWTLGILPLCRRGFAVTPGPKRYPDKWVRWSTGQSIGMSAALLCFVITWGNNGSDLCKLLGNVWVKSSVSNLSIMSCF